MPSTPKTRTLTLETATVGPATVLTPRGALTHECIAQLETAMLSGLSSATSMVILNCTSVSLIDSESLERLLKVHDTLMEQGRQLKLVGVTGVCRDILVATRLYAVLQVFDDIHKAIYSES